jgi:NAD(P)-dependent dehydrogenase (short-subunit alcohol dehydrogenase family)
MAGAVVIGAGPGLGRSIARRFAREGMPVALLARRQETVDATAATLGGPVLPLRADAADESSLLAALDAATDAFAERYWQLHCQPRQAWELEVAYTGEPTTAATT